MERQINCTKALQITWQDFPLQDGKTNYQPVFPYTFSQKITNCFQSDTDNGAGRGKERTGSGTQYNRTARRPFWTSLPE